MPNATRYPTPADYTSQYSGQLNKNKIYTDAAQHAIMNMIISQEVFADNFDGLDTGFADQFRVDGSMYGDVRLYYAVDALPNYPWIQDSDDALNVIPIKRAAVPNVQKITMDVFRQVEIGLDNYLSKQAWQSETSFADFTSVLLAMLRDSKQIYDYTTLASYVGTMKSSKTAQNVTMTLPTASASATNAEKESINRLRGEMISKKIADLQIAMKRPSRDFNEYGNLRAFNPATMSIVFNSDYVTELRNMDTPTVFSSDEILKNISDNVLAPEFFGTVLSTSGTSATASPVRSLVEKDYTSGNDTVHCIPGDEIPGGAAYAAGEAYTPNKKIICKIINKKALPFMSGFAVQTEFVNGKNLSRNNYLTWGHNTLEYLKNYPLITITEA